MLTATRATEFYSTDQYKEIDHLLHYAETKLLAEMPQQLKMVSYLRLCCTAIRKLRQSEPSGKHSVSAFDASYIHLLQALCDHNPEWWKHCWISDRGILQSNDPIIDKLLQPLTSFIAIYSCATSNN